MDKSNPIVFEDSISNSKKKFSSLFGQALKSNNFLETSRISKKDAHINTDRNLNLVGNIILIDSF